MVLRDYLTKQLKDKTVFVRVDFNVPIVDGWPVQTQRMKEHAKTVNLLLKMGAKVVLLAHQGRPGKRDFVHLDKHATVFSKIINRPVRFVSDVVGKRAQHAVLSLRPGEVLLLDNVRMVEDEMKCHDKRCKKSMLVKTYKDICDVFILDAFSVAHRAHASVIGFSDRAIPGPVLLDEVNHLKRLKNAKNVVLVLGGGKPEDTLKIIKKWCSDGRAYAFLLTGVPAVIILSYYFPNRSSIKFIEQKGFESLIKKYVSLSNKCKMFIPRDVNVNGKIINIEDLSNRNVLIKDIGPKTVEYYSQIINRKTVLFNGPAGVYEEGYVKGTCGLLRAISKAKMSYLGGGDTLEVLKKCRISRNKFTYVSLSGKAFIKYVSGESLPGLRMLKLE
ncbi:phosphoglycerate kinase [Candidatus Micrarchaeota archaeon]|nr:phosphoglycerate kinase [Candidatus Micrarchaeota archaeon]